MKHFRASFEMCVNCFETVLLILSESSNHTIKLMTILILYCSKTDWFLLVNFHAEFHTAESQGSNSRVISPY